MPVIGQMIAPALGKVAQALPGQAISQNRPQGPMQSVPGQVQQPLNPPTSMYGPTTPSPTLGAAMGIPGFNFLGGNISGMLPTARRGAGFFSPAAGAATGAAIGPGLGGLWGGMTALMGGRSNPQPNPAAATGGMLGRLQGSPVLNELMGISQARGLIRHPGDMENLIRKTMLGRGVLSGTDIANKLRGALGANAPVPGSGLSGAAIGAGMGPLGVGIGSMIGGPMGGWFNNPAIAQEIAKNPEPAPVPKFNSILKQPVAANPAAQAAAQRAAQLKNLQSIYGSLGGAFGGGGTPFSSIARGAKRLWNKWF